MNRNPRQSRHHQINEQSKSNIHLDAGTRQETHDKTMSTKFRRVIKDEFQAVREEFQTAIIELQANKDELCSIQEQLEIGSSVSQLKHLARWP